MEIETHNIPQYNETQYKIIKKMQNILRSPLVHDLELYIVYQSPPTYISPYYRTLQIKPDTLFYDLTRPIEEIYVIDRTKQGIPYILYSPRMINPI